MPHRPGPARGGARAVRTAPPRSWRTRACGRLAGLVFQGLLVENEAHEMAHECAYSLAKHAYRVPEMSYVTR